MLTDNWVENGTIVSVHNGNEEIRLNCKVNMETLEVFDFDLSAVFNKDLHVLNREYLILNGIEWDVYGTSDELRLEADFWYDDTSFIIYHALRETDFYGDDISKTVYVFYGDHYLKKGILDAAAVNVELTILKHFENESKSIYVCKATDNLMRLYSNPK